MPSVNTDYPHFPAHAVASTPRAQTLEMAPFRGVRYAPAAHRNLAAVTAPPYDLISDGDARLLADAHPRNVVRLIRSRDRDAAQSYQDAETLLQRWLDQGDLIIEEVPALYVYEQRSGSEVIQRGLVGGLGLADPKAGVVLPHEDTMPGPIDDRLRLMHATGSNLEPIFLLYEGGQGAASALVDEVATTRDPVAAARTADSVSHRLWRVTDPVEHEAINADLRGRSALIADGHHRYATYLRYQAERNATQHQNPDVPGCGPASSEKQPWDYGLALLVDSQAYPPHVDAVHRVLPALPLSTAVDRARRAFRVTTLRENLPATLEILAEASAQGPAFAIAGDGRHHLLERPDADLLARSMPTGHSPTWRSLAPAVLHAALLPEVWGIDDSQAQDGIAFHHDAAAACAAAQGAGGTAVLLNPIPAEEVLALAREGERVPRKSTSFHPKPRTGLVMRLLDVGNP